MNGLRFRISMFLLLGCVACATYPYKGKKYATPAERDRAMVADREATEKAQMAEVDALLFAGINRAEVVDLRAMDWTQGVDWSNALQAAWTHPREFPELAGPGEDKTDEFAYRANKQRYETLRKTRLVLAVHFYGGGERDPAFAEYDFDRQCFPLAPDDVGKENTGSPNGDRRMKVRHVTHFKDGIANQISPFDMAWRPYYGQSSPDYSYVAGRPKEVGASCIRIPEQRARKGPRKYYFLYEIVGPGVSNVGTQKVRFLNVRLAKYVVVFEDGTILQ